MIDPEVELQEFIEYGLKQLEEYLAKCAEFEALYGA